MPYEARVHKVDWYRIKTAFIGLKRLATLPEEDRQACIDAYKFFQRMQAGEKTETEDETNAVADYYKVLNNMLSIFDLEKLYIPPLLSDSEGLSETPPSRAAAAQRGTSSTRRLSARPASLVFGAMGARKPTPWPLSRAASIP